MRLIKKILLTSILLLNILIANADSPLTSTDFHKAYKDLPAFSNFGEGMCEYLSNDANPIEYRLAVINRDGWSPQGKSRANILMDYILQRYDANMDNFFEKVSGEVIICLAYIAALDNYSNVELASLMAESAEAKAPNNYAVYLISALIHAQKSLLDSDWCGVYQETNLVRTEFANKQRNMRKEAIDLIFMYQDGYEKYCN